MRHCESGSRNSPMPTSPRASAILRRTRSDCRSCTRKWSWPTGSSSRRIPSQRELRTSAGNIRREGGARLITTSRSRRLETPEHAAAQEIVVLSALPGLGEWEIGLTRPIVATFTADEETALDPDIEANPILKDRHTFALARVCRSVESCAVFADVAKAGAE